MNKYKNYMKVIEAVNEYDGEGIKVFLAGGITNCPDWQAEVIKHLEKYTDTDDLIVYNPRRSFFDVTDKSASYKQIKWEFDYLAKMDIFSMYFTNSESVQPICFYELGRHLAVMQQRFPDDFKSRIVLSVEKGFSREIDVLTQSRLALRCNVIAEMGEPIDIDCGINNVVYLGRNPEQHAQSIYNAYKILKLMKEFRLKQSIES